MVNFRKSVLFKNQIKNERNIHLYGISDTFSCAFLLPSYCRYFDKTSTAMLPVFHCCGLTWPKVR